MTDLPPIEQIRLAHPEGSLVRKLAEELERERIKRRYLETRVGFIEAQLRGLLMPRKETA